MGTESGSRDGGEHGANRPVRDPVNGSWRRQIAIGVGCSLLIFLLSFLFPYKSIPRQILPSLSLAVFPVVTIFAEGLWLRQYFRSLQKGEEKTQAISDQAAAFFEVKPLTVYKRVGGEKPAGSTVAPLEGAILLDPFHVELLSEDELRFLITRAHAERKFEKLGLRPLLWLCTALAVGVLICFQVRKADLWFGLIILMAALVTALWIFVFRSRIKNRDFIIDEMALAHTGNRPAAVRALVIEQFGKPEPYANLDSWPQLDPDRYDRYQRLKGAM